ncbi:MAG TPA: hypothetical protein VND54_03080 [Candidatus Saccharimonadales bacterium]|nr:hypothetical protein [Candidatus Saccharimonadales bacterium]
MSDIERDLEELGRHVWPSPEQVRGRVRSGERRRGRGRWHRFGGSLGALLGAAAAIVVIGGVSAAGILALQQHRAGASLGADKNGASGTVVPAANTGGHSGLGGIAAGSGPSESARLSPAPQLSSSPSPSLNPPPVGGTLVVTANSRGTYEVKIGTTISVDLTGGTFSAPWGMPSSTPAQIVRFKRGSRSDGGGVSATFVAVGPGDATIQAAQSPHCPPLCGPPSYLWGIKIIVVA